MNSRWATMSTKSSRCTLKRCNEAGMSPNGANRREDPRLDRRHEGHDAFCVQGGVRHMDGVGGQVATRSSGHREQRTQGRHAPRGGRPLAAAKNGIRRRARPTGDAASRERCPDHGGRVRGRFAHRSGSHRPSQKRAVRDRPYPRMARLRVGLRRSRIPHDARGPRPSGRRGVVRVLRQQAQGTSSPSALPRARLG